MKIIKVFSLILLLLVMGCSKKEYITCNINIDNDAQNYEMIGVYKIYYDDKYVTKIEKEETYISSDKNILNYFEESKNLDYYNLNDIYNGYTYTINNKDNSIEISAVIDMDKVNIKDMVKDNYIDKNYVISNKLTTSGIVKIYESKGAVCNI